MILERMGKDAVLRGGLAMLLALAVLAGCSDSEKRKSVKDALAVQRAANNEEKKASLVLGSQSLTQDSRFQKFMESKEKTEKMLGDLLKSQPNNWQAKAQLGASLMQKADFLSSRVNEELSHIRQDVTYSSQSFGYLKNYDLLARRVTNSKTAAVEARQALATEKAKLKNELATVEGRIADAKRQYTDLSGQAKEKDAAAKTQRDGADVIMAETDKMNLSEEKLAKQAGAYQKQVACAKLQADAADLDCQAELLYDAKTRDEKSADLAAPTSAPDDPAAVAKRVAALQAIPDATARAELSVLAIQGRLAAIDKEDADYQRRLDNANRSLGEAAPAAPAPAASSAPDDLKTLRTTAQAGIRMGLERVDGECKKLDETVKRADAAYADAIGQLLNGANGAKQAVNVSAELNVRLDLATAYGNRGQLHLALADAAGLFDEARSIARDPQMAGLDVPAGEGGTARKLGDLSFGPYALAAQNPDDKVKLAADERKAATESIFEAAWIIDDVRPLADKAEKASRDSAIRDAQLWTAKVLTDRRTALSNLAGVPAIPPRTTTGAGAPSSGGGPNTGGPSTPPATTPPASTPPPAKP